MLWTGSQTCCALCSVLLENTQSLIQEQTRNETTDPKSGGMISERYHSLEDVNQDLHTLTSERKINKYINPFVFFRSSNLGRIVFIVIISCFIQIYYFLNKTNQDNANMTKLILIGSSFEKNPLYVLKVNLFRLFLILSRNTTIIRLPTWPRGWFIFFVFCWHQYFISILD